MSIFLVKRLATLIATLWLTSIMVFALLEILPGDPALTMLGVDAPASAVAALRAELGLERPAVARYGSWMLGLLSGDLGMSFTYKVPASGLIFERLALTLPLALLAMVMTTCLALCLGVYAASRHNRFGDYGVMGFAQIGIALPSFWFGILLILLFAVELKWFPSGGFPGWRDGFWPALQALILPASALALFLSAVLSRITRSALLEVVQEDFVRTARAKGLSRRQALWRHVLRNALIPVVTVMGLQFATLLAGTIVIENVFSLPGLGKLLLEAIANRDLTIVKDVTMLLAILVVLVNFAVDLLYAVIDPRVKIHG